MLGKLFVFLLLCCPCCPSLAGDRGMCVCGSQSINGEVGYFTVTRIADFEDGSTAWLTAGHCVDIGPMELIDGKGVKYAATVVADSRPTGHVVAEDAADLALVRGPGFENKVFFRLVDKAPRRAAVYSFVGRDRKKMREMNLEDSGTLWGDSQAEQGESGAPAFVDDECYGLLIGCTHDKTECFVSRDGVRRCRLVSRGRIIFERSRTINRWLETTTYQPCVPILNQPAPPLNPEPQTRLDGEYDRQIAALRLRIESLETRRLLAGPAGPQGLAGPKGDNGPQGPAGLSGVVTVVLEDNGKQLFKAPDVLSGSTVRVPIRRTEKTSTGSN
jgi:hypothetical protein